MVENTPLHPRPVRGTLLALAFGGTKYEKENRDKWERKKMKEEGKGK
jgi:hypothetical protein